MTDSDYRNIDNLLLDELGDTFALRVENELHRIESAYAPFTDKLEAFKCIEDEVKELKIAIFTCGDQSKRIRHELAQIAARCCRMDKDLYVSEP